MQGASQSLFGAWLLLESLLARFSGMSISEKGRSGYCKMEKLGDLRPLMASWQVLAHHAVAIMSMLADGVAWLRLVWQGPPGTPEAFA